MAPKSDKQPFNIEFGKAMRGVRIMYGYARAEDFASAVEEKTGIKFPLDTLRRIESGRQNATVEQFAAICLTLNGSVPGLILHHTLSGLDGTMHDVFAQGVERDRNAAHSIELF